MNDRYMTEKGLVVAYKQMRDFLIYGNIGPLEFYVRVNCPVEASETFDRYKARLYVPVEQVKDRVKLGLSPSAKVTEI